MNVSPVEGLFFNRNGIMLYGICRFFKWVINYADKYSFSDGSKTSPFYYHFYYHRVPQFAKICQDMPYLGV